MKHLNTTATQQLPAILLLALVCLNPLPVNATADIADKTTDIASERYQAGIEKLGREIIAAKAHRTALVSRMDDITGELSKLESEKKALLTDKNPTVTRSLNAINQDISKLQLQINENNNLYSIQKSIVDHLPQPSLLADALASESALQQHREMAIQAYLLHKSEIAVGKARDMQQQLLSKKVTMTLKSKELQGNIGEYQQGVATLKESRQSLELNFTHLSSTIVKKQDRLERLKLRMAELELEPEKALISNHQGMLHDPTEGVLQHRYSEPKARGMLKWEGILVSANAGQQIEAVFDGTVVFADRMQGLGYVAILDHGEGYMSLYGMADFLIVEPGQTLLGGDTIGNVGGSDKDDESTLYFEIRHNANTLNPQDWLAFRQISDEN